MTYHPLHWDFNIVIYVKQIIYFVQMCFGL